MNRHLQGIVVAAMLIVVIIALALVLLISFINMNQGQFIVIVGIVAIVGASIILHLVGNSHAKSQQEHLQTNEQPMRKYEYLRETRPLRFNVFEFIKEKRAQSSITRRVAKWRKERKLIVAKPLQRARSGVRLIYRSYAAKNHARRLRSKYL